MRQRVEVRETVIAPGAVVRLSTKAAKTWRELAGRWRVVHKDGDTVVAKDTFGTDEVRSFQVNDLERVSGGESVVVGHEYVTIPTYCLPDEEHLDEDDPEDPVVVYERRFSVGEFPSLFDDRDRELRRMGRK